MGNDGVGEVKSLEGSQRNETQRWLGECVADRVVVRAFKDVGAQISCAAPDGQRDGLDEFVLRDSVDLYALDVQVLLPVLGRIRLCEAPVLEYQKRAVQQRLQTRHRTFPFVVEKHYGRRRWSGSVRHNSALRE